MWFVFLFSVVLSFARINVGDDTDNLFISPPSPGPNENYTANLQWTLGSTQNIQWTTTLDSYYIALFQQASDVASGGQLMTLHST